MSPAPDITAFVGVHAYLSNLYECKPLPSVEHYLQASKTKDAAEKLAIMNASAPAWAARIGNATKPHPGWKAERVGVLRSLLAEKFFPGTVMSRQLIDTRGAYIVYGNDKDRVWGCVRVGNEWIGDNRLGLLLMERRATLQRKEFTLSIPM
jgi:ribA/ribD-fused uncharacterized protein